MAPGLMVDLAARTQGKTHVSSVVRLIGTLEPATLPVAEKAVRPLLEDGPRVLVFDLSALEFISSTGVGFLLGAKAAMERRKGACYLTNLPPKIRKAFDVMKALPDTSIFATVGELDDYLAAIQRQVDEETKGPAGGPAS